VDGDGAFGGPSDTTATFSDPTQIVELAAGQNVQLTYRNTQRRAIVFFHWDPIFPDGLGAGRPSYGMSRRAVATAERAVADEEENRELAGASSLDVFQAP
jgi:hypothetical protein